VIDMRNVLVTGMSGTGKSTALAELAKRGSRVIETDRAPWSEWSDVDGGYVWREELIEELLARDDEGALFVSGTVSNQGRLYPRFDAVVLLSAPLEVLLRRVDERTANGYGKSEEERAEIVQNFADVEPLLRATCTHEIDATQPVDIVVSQLVAIAETG
jgi:shikimate kinase